MSIYEYYYLDQIQNLTATNLTASQLPPIRIDPPDTFEGADGGASLPPERIQRQIPRSDTTYPNRMPGTNLPEIARPVPRQGNESNQQRRRSEPPRVPQEQEDSYPRRMPDILWPEIPRGIPEAADDASSSRQQPRRVPESPGRIPEILKRIPERVSEIPRSLPEIPRTLPEIPRTLPEAANDSLSIPISDRIRSEIPRTIPEIINNTSSRQIPDRNIPKPPSDEQETFIRNGQKYECKWVYCCQPVGPSFVQKQEPNENETYQDIVIWKDENFPEYKAEKCNNSIGVCLSTRKSIFRLIGRIIYPKDVPDFVEGEIKACLNEAANAIYAVIAGQIAAMEAVPPSIPAFLASILETAFITGKAAFISCIERKASYEYIKGKIRFSVYHDQEEAGEWHTFNDKDALALLEKFQLYSTGLAFIPGIGSFEDLANKIGLDTKGLNNALKNAGESLSKAGDNLLDIGKDIAENLGRSIGLSN